MDSLPENLEQMLREMVALQRNIVEDCHRQQCRGIILGAVVATLCRQADPKVRAAITAQLTGVPRTLFADSVPLLTPEKADLLRQEAELLLKLITAAAPEPSRGSPAAQ